MIVGVWSLVLGTALAGAADERPSLAQAYRDYVTESTDYLQTLGDTEEELRVWRSSFLRDQYDAELTRLEDTLIQANQSILNELEKYIRKEGIDGLDDVL